MSKAARAAKAALRFIARNMSNSADLMAVTVAKAAMSFSKPPITSTRLSTYRYQQHHAAKNGIAGAGKLRSGLNGDDLVLRVPVGTEILDEDKENRPARSDLGWATYRLHEGRAMAVSGTRITNHRPIRRPAIRTPGYPGQECVIWLRLKLIADAGLVGAAQRRQIDFFGGLHSGKTKNRGLPFYNLVAEPRSRAAGWETR